MVIIVYHKMNSSLLEADILLSPNRWTKRFAANVVFEKHIEIIVKLSEETRRQIPCDLNIPYGSGQREKIDVYGTDLPEDAPIFLHIHGGYWHEEAITHTNNSFPAKCLHKNGIKSIFIGYELCPHLTLSDIVERLEKAVHKCLNYAKKHKSRGIYLSGHSAGAHLVALLFQTCIPSLTTEDRKLFKSAFLLCGLYDLLPLLETQVNQILELDEHSAKSLSPVFNNIGGIDVEFNVVVAQNDSPVFHKQGKQYNDYLLGRGLSSRYVFVENVDHYEILEKLIDDEFQVTRLVIDAIKC